MRQLLLLGRQLLALIVPVDVKGLFVCGSIRCLPEVQASNNVIAQLVLVGIQNLLNC